MRLAALPLARGRVRGDPLHARDPLRRLLLRRLPAAAVRERKVRARGAAGRKQLGTCVTVWFGPGPTAGTGVSLGLLMDLSAELQRHFGFASFRPGQREACEAALADRDVMVVMPTGSGKSLCYQLPALLRDDLTAVGSPLWR